jgi:2,4-dienoyl-CoA reductase-like NADH-dependent reductase (Old Yellow Enzyme family)
VETIRAIRQAVGGDYPVLVKMNCEDFSEGGLTVTESIEAARQMVAAGLDAIELSGGLLTGGKLSPSRPNINTEEKEAYFKEAARAFKKVAGRPADPCGRDPLPGRCRRPVGRRERPITSPCPAR